MHIEIDGDRLTLQEPSGPRTINIGTAEAFAVLSRLWLRSGWDTKYVYSFTWMGRPMIQLPEDMIRIQEVIYEVKPDVIVETGIAHGGSLVFYASLFEALGHGRVIGVDIEIRKHNRAAIESHRLKKRIDLIEGSSIEPSVVAQVMGAIKPDERVLVILDSNHTRRHVLDELRCYAPLVAPGSYIVACDGIMKEVVGAPRTRPEWGHDNPQSAVQDFLAENTEFKLVEPRFPFNEGMITQRVTYWPNAFLQRVGLARS